MLSQSESLLPQFSDRPLRVQLIGIDEGEPRDLQELSELLKTLDAQEVGRTQIHLRKITPATYVGGGKLEDIKLQANVSKADVVIFDVDLSPSQMQKIEKALEMRILDRAGVILEIFSRHAQSNEAKVQVELAKMNYLLPRLTHYWSHFERQRGGGLWNKGMGEKQIEVDRRLVRTRIKRLERRLSSIGGERDLRRKNREDVLKVALVGYTNAGKSTLLNELTQSDVKAENRLFATLDSSVRSLDPFSKPPIVAIDTVGFIDRIPTFLIASFRSTLEELQYADLLLHVVDASSPNCQNQIEVTRQVLDDLGLGEKPTIVVLNKMDQVENQVWTKLTAAREQRLQVSALNPKDVDRLRETILSFFRKQMEVIEIFVPYAESRIHSDIFAFGHVEVEREMPEGMFYRLRMPLRWIDKLCLERFKI